MLAYINTRFTIHQVLGEEAYPFSELQKLLFANFISDALLQSKIQPRIGDDWFRGRVLFSRAPSLYLLTQALMYSSDEGLEPVGKEPSGFLLGECFLMANDLLAPKKDDYEIEHGSDEKRLRHLALQMSLNFEISNTPTIARAINRFDKLYNQMAGSTRFKAELEKDGLKFVNLNEKFKQLTGLSLETYSEFGFGLVSYVLRQEVDQTDGYPGFSKTRFIEKCRIPQDEFNAFLKLESIDLDNIDAVLRNKHDKPKRDVAVAWRHVALKPKPILEHKNGYFIPLDAGHLVAKLDSGVYWKIFDSLKSRDERSAFQTFFGHLFEFYVNDLLRTAVESDPYRRAVFFDDVRCRKGDRMFDAMVLYPKTGNLVVFEHKASLLTVAAKYSGKIRKFEDDLKRKFLAKEDGKPKGLGQLVNHISNVFSPNYKTEAPTNNDDLNTLLKTVESVTPVLVGFEPFLQSHLIEKAYFRAIYNREISKRKVSSFIELRPLNVFHIEFLEELSDYISKGDFTLEECFGLRHFRDPNLLHKFDIGFLREFGLIREFREAETANRALTEFVEQVGEKWFGIQDSNSQTEG